MIELLYKQMCPNCGSDIKSERLYAGLLCEKCQPQPGDPCEVADKEFAKVCEVREEFASFAHFFKEKIGFPLRSIQATWVKRFFLGLSYALLAPTGIGKTSFGLALAAYLKPKKSYLLFPTQALAKQAYERLLKMGEEALLYDSHLSKSKKEEIKKRIERGDFVILVTTTSFLYKNIQIIPKPFDFVFVDDVDSVLKSARNIDKVLMLLGFTPEDIEAALELIDLKIRFAQGRGVDEERFEALRVKVQEASKRARGSLIVSSATAAPKSKRVRLFRELLGFEVGRPSITMRNVEDIYEEPDELWDRSLKRIEEFGRGGLVFLPSSATKEELEAYLAYLQERGIAAISYEEFDKRAHEFEAGNVQVVVGFASYRNPLARGIDMPQTIRYALFVGVPKLEFTLDLSHHSTIYYFLLSLLPAIKDEPFYQKALEYVNYLKRVLYIPQDRLNEKVRERIEAIRAELLAFLSPQMVEKINQNPDISLQKDEYFKLVTADVTGYIQASGRTSRLYAGGLTKGLAFMLVDNQKAFRSLQKKLRWFSEEISFKRADEVDMAALMHRIDEDRERVRLALEGKLEGKDPFSTVLVIVESPHKAGTIAGFYGKPMVRNVGGVQLFEVMKENKMLVVAASKGHVFDLNKEEGYYGVLRDGGFREVFEPIDEGRRSIVEALRSEGVQVDEIYVATDPDTEGEKISFDLCCNEKPYNAAIKRAEFHEVTKRAFDEALKEPRDLNENLVRAQLVRRVADRWIGFEVSHYIQQLFGRKTLSAGRVQTAVLEWIVEREKEARQRVYVVVAKFADFEVEFAFESASEAKEFYEQLQEVDVHLEKEEKSLFKTPLSTDAMLFEASNTLHYSPQKTMQLAQDLFEAGFITYHRTDSVRVSPVGVALAKEYISEHFGVEYFVPRPHSRSYGAHECIRPTRVMDAEDLEEFLRLQPSSQIGEEHLRLYDLIFRHFIASQMREVKVQECHAKVEALGRSGELRFICDILQDGFNLILPIETKSLQEGSYPVQKELTQRPKAPRYSYAQIVKLMKERGIGRPSTYAITIEKLHSRRYIYQRGGVLFATKLGMEVMAAIKRRPSIYAFVNENYTKELEGLMDAVERGEASFDEVIGSLYEKIQKEIHENTL